jgi:hypothetical protein
MTTRRNFVRIATAAGAELTGPVTTLHWGEATVEG